MEEVPENLSFKKRTRNLLGEMKAKGVTKFCSYDVLGKKATPIEIERLQTALYELVMSGEIERAKDVHGNFKKVRPSDAVSPDWLRCKVMLNQYVIKDLGQKKPVEATSWYRRQNALKAKVEKKARVISVWETIWPDLYKVPTFKSKKVITNQCMD